jgi:hypothetical protein
MGSNPDASTELRRWYAGRLRPKLDEAARRGTIPLRAADYLDELLEPLLGARPDPDPATRTWSSRS